MQFAAWDRTAKLRRYPQVGSKDVVDETEILTFSCDDFVEFYSLGQRSSLDATELLRLACPELLLILEVVRNFKFHATCNGMALSTKHY